ncbi:MAG: C-type lectin domain-containing protein [Myxococcota bacterium]
MWLTLFAALASSTGTPEVCNGVDDDENGLVDDGAVCTGCRQLNFETRSYLVCEDDQTDRAAASALCEGFGYHLVDVQSEAENAALLPELSLLQTYWTGLSDSTPNTYRWSDGELATYVPWSATQPDDLTGTEDCAWYFAVSGAQVHGFNDVPCSAEGAGAVCESADSEFECDTGLDTDDPGPIPDPLPETPPPAGHVLCGPAIPPSWTLFALALVAWRQRKARPTASPAVRAPL